MRDMINVDDDLIVRGDVEWVVYQELIVMQRENGNEYRIDFAGGSGSRMGF